jgi:hypothetical protein
MSLDVQAFEGKQQLDRFASFYHLSYIKLPQAVHSGQVFLGQGE